MTTKCTDCHCIIEDGEARANLPIGVKCSPCSDKYYESNGKLKSFVYDSIPDKRVTPKEPDELKSVFKHGVTKIAGQLIPNTLLEDYKNHVDYLRRVCNSSLSLRDPLITMKALQEREKIHRKIFKVANLIYHADDNATKLSIEFNTALDKYIS